MIEVLAEIALGNLLPEILVGGRHHSYIDCYILVAADLGELVLLQHAEDLGLGRQRHVAYLIQEKSAAVSLLKLALVLLLRSGERAFLVTEKLALDKLARDGRAVYLDERHRRAVALLVQPTGHQLLARTVGTGDKHPRVRRCHPVYHILDTDYGGRLAYDLLHSSHLLLESLGLADQRTLVRGIFQSNKYPVQVQRFLNEIIRSLLYALHRSIYGAVTGNHHYRSFVSALGQFVQHLHSVHARHLDVAEYHIEIAGRSGLKSRRAVLGQRYLVPLELQYLLECIADTPLVIYNENLHNSPI